MQDSKHEHSCGFCLATRSLTLYTVARGDACVPARRVCSCNTRVSPPLSLSLVTETLKKEEFHKVAQSYSFGLLLNGCAVSRSGSKMSLDGAAQVCVCPCVSMCVHVCPCSCALCGWCHAAIPGQGVSVCCLHLCMCLCLMMMIGFIITLGEIM